MPKDFNQIPSSAPKDKQMAGVRITPERLLHEQRQAIEALAHVRVTRGEPHPHAGRNRDHRRPTTMPRTATMVSRSTGPAIRTRPPAHSTSTTPPLAGGECGGSAGEGSASGTKAGAGGGSAEGACCRSSRRHRNKRLGVIPCRRATAEIDPVARCASSTMARWASPLGVALPHFWWSSKPPMKHNVLGVPRLSIFRAAPIAKWQQAAGLPKNAFTSNGITALGLLPFHQKCGRAARPLVRYQLNRQLAG